MSGLLLKADFSSHIGSVGFVPIVLQKSAALMGFSLGTSASVDADLGSARASAFLVLI
jgi:hypothetical protein